MEGCRRMNCIVQEKKMKKKRNKKELSSNTIITLVPDAHVNVEIHLPQHVGQLDSLAPVVQRVDSTIHWITQ